MKLPKLQHSDKDQPNTTNAAHPQSAESAVSHVIKEALLRLIDGTLQPLLLDLGWKAVQHNVADFGSRGLAGSSASSLACIRVADRLFQKGVRLSMRSSFNHENKLQTKQPQNK